MAKRYALSGLVIVLLIAGLLASACGGATEPTPTPTSTVTPTVAANTGSGKVVDDMAEDPFLLGERIFKEAAAEGVGCQYCHGPDARGDIGPNIRGKMPGDIQFALKNVDAMSFIHLSQEEIEAVSTYLQWLATQP